MESDMFLASLFKNKKKEQTRNVTDIKTDAVTALVTDTEMGRHQKKTHQWMVLLGQNSVSHESLGERLVAACLVCR